MNWVFIYNNNVFEFLVFDGEKWVSFVREALFEPVEFDPRFKLALNLDDLAWAQDNLLEQANWRELMSGDEDSLLELKKFKIPQVLILSSGEVSAFQLTAQIKEQSEPVYFIEGDSYYASEFTPRARIMRQYNKGFTLLEVLVALSLWLGSCSNASNQ